MSNLRRLASLVLAMVLIVTLFIGATRTALADQNADEGSYSISVFSDGQWQPQGELSFSDYESLQLPLNNDAGQLRLRLTQYGHDGAFVDYLALEKDGAAYVPVSAINIDNNADVLAKVLSSEYDVCDAHDGTLEVVWENVPGNATLVMRAMEEDFGEGHGSPLYYPRIWQGEMLSHTITDDGGISVDGWMEEPEEPDFSVFWQPDSPHPDGYTYGWLHSDGNYLYAAVEVTADNTCDEEDWAALYLMVNGEMKEFRVSDSQQQYGVGGFQYTSSVLYEHRIYEFRIPLGEMDASISTQIQYGFGCYGTVSQQWDYGDAPAPYPTLQADSGAQHHVNSNPPPLHLGANIDIEWDGLPNSTATGDDNNNLDDEDGVIFNTALIPNTNAQVTVIASGKGLLDAWIDWNANGSWIDVGDQVFDNYALLTGQNILNISVPAGATLGTTFARFRFSSAGVVSFTGLAPDGEVEDYHIRVGEAPSPEPEPHHAVGGVVYPAEKLALLLPLILGVAGTAFGFLWLKRRHAKR